MRMARRGRGGEHSVDVTLNATEALKPAWIPGTNLTFSLLLRHATFPLRNVTEPKEPGGSDGTSACYKPS